VPSKRRSAYWSLGIFGPHLLGPIHRLGRMPYFLKVIELFPSSRRGAADTDAPVESPRFRGLSCCPHAVARGLPLDPDNRKARPRQRKKEW